MGTVFQNGAREGANARVIEGASNGERGWKGWKDERYKKGDNKGGTEGERPGESGQGSRREGESAHTRARERGKVFVRARVKESETEEEDMYQLDA